MDSAATSTDRTDARRPDLVPVGAFRSGGFSSDDLVGLLADPVRLRVVAALALGANNLDDLQRETGSDLRSLTRAVTRLCDAGLVVSGEERTLFLVEEAFRVTARAAAAERRPGVDEHGDAPRAEAKVLRAFVREGRLVAIPAAAAKRRVILEWLAQRFEPGERYSETMVNLILGRVHADTAALRRYLVDDNFLDRADGTYWRCGGRTD